MNTCYRGGDRRRGGMLIITPQMGSLDGGAQGHGRLVSRLTGCGPDGLGDPMEMGEIPDSPSHQQEAR